MVFKKEEKVVCLLNFGFKCLELSVFTNRNNDDYWVVIPILKCKKETFKLSGHSKSSKCQNSVTEKKNRIFFFWSLSILKS